MSSRFRSALFIIIFYVLFFLVMRGIFYHLFRAESAGVSGSQILNALFIGLRFDIRVATILTLPLILFSLIPWTSWTQSNWHKLFWTIFYTILTSVVALVMFLDLGYYSYLQSRINNSIFQFAENAGISLKMMWESYNLSAIVILLIGISTSYYVFLSKFIFKLQPIQKSNWQLKTLKRGSTFVVIVLSLHSSLSQYPLRWSDAFFSEHMFASYLAMNPVHYFVDTIASKNTDYSADLVRENYEIVASYLGVKDLNRDKLLFERDVPLTPKFKTPPNIIYIVMESFAAYKTGAFGNPYNPSPRFDELASKAVLFENFFTPTEGTARSMFCTLTGIPDINAKSSSSRNPLIVKQHTLLNYLQKHEKYYFIGGSATWGNIRGIYKNNVPGLKLYEEDNLNGPRTDVWGLSDLHLFREAARILKERNHQSEPFFALIQSASFHRPYTIPDDHGNFKLETLSADELKQSGFHSNDEYNSFRFSDYSLGEFLDLIKNSEFFDNTIIVIHGDHGLPNHNARHLSNAYKFHNVNRFHVPLVIYSKGLKPEKRKIIASQPDVLPSLIGISGVTGTHRSLGRNLFALKDSEESYALSYVYYTNPLQIFLFEKDFIVFGTENEIDKLYYWNSNDPQINMREKYPEKFLRMKNIANGLFQTSKWLLHHNHPIKPK